MRGGIRERLDAIPHGNLRGTAPVPDRMWGQPTTCQRHACWPLLPVALALAAGCKEPSDPRYDFDSAMQERGKAVIERVGCGACHEIPGVDWPQGRLGPSLSGFDDIGLIAGALPNDMENLAAFIRNAPAVKPGSTMPEMPVTVEESRAIAAYLYGLNDV